MSMLNNTGRPSIPGWQTEELNEEWIDLEPEESSDGNIGYETRSIFSTEPRSTHIQTSNVSEDHYIAHGEPRDEPEQIGTFLVREDVYNAPILPKTPGRQSKRTIRDFFTPSQLEQLFEPPSPRETQRYPIITENLSHKSSVPSHPSQACSSPTARTPQPSNLMTTPMKLSTQFTFTVPHPVGFGLPENGNTPPVQNTPNNSPFPGRIPATDFKLRLFQFQYDTYTRDQLSAMVDSIAVNSPSGTGTTDSPLSCIHGLSRISEASDSVEDISRLRSAKRVKLSPKSDFYGEGAGANATIGRPRVTGKDYVGESRSLMRQIRQTRDFSVLSTSQPSSPNHTKHIYPRQTLAKNDVPGGFPRQTFFRTIGDTDRSTSYSGTATPESSSYSSSMYREQAAALMAQIRDDMKGQKRSFSGDTDASAITALIGGKAELAIELASSSQLMSTVTNDFHQCHNQMSSSGSNTPPKGKSKTVHQLSLRSESLEAPHIVKFQSDPEVLTNGIAALGLQDHAPHVNAHGEVSLRGQSRGQSEHNSKVPILLDERLAVPSKVSSRPQNNENLNRFVSTSTTSGTTLTVGSLHSFIKHAGPAQIRTIAPGDVPALPDRLGDMVYDKLLMKWVKNATSNGRAVIGGEDASDDPFNDIESLRDESRGQDGLLHGSNDKTESLPGAQTIDKQSDVDDEEEIDLMNFSTDGPACLVVPVLVDGDGLGANVQTSCPEVCINKSASAEEETHYDLSGQAVPEVNSPTPRLHPTESASTALDSELSRLTPMIRSALKNQSATPNSVLKNPVQNRYQTPLSKTGRSVSFSDGKMDGPICGLNESISTEGDSDITQSVMGETSAAGSNSGFLLSTGSKRIADMMNALVDSDSDGNEFLSQSVGEENGRSNQPQQTPPTHDIDGSRSLHPSSLGRPNSSTRRSSSHSHSHKSPQGGNGRKNKANATFLTECSFGIAHDRLVEVITEAQPFEPHWETLTSIDLSKKKLESVVRLKEFLPQLDLLNLNANLLTWLTGVPGTMRTLSVASNNLTGITSYGHLLNLESLDISNNDVDSLRQFMCLRHLRELKADGNQISSVDGLEHMDGLVKLSLQDNCIQTMDLTQCRWTRLEMLNISHNRVDSIYGLASLQSLIALNLDNNTIEELEVVGSMPKLRILRVSGNRLHQLWLGSMPNIRTLYADNNSLSTLVRLDRLSKLENLSLRNQSGRGFHLSSRDIRDVKRLYLSGNPLKARFLEEPCYNLIYLELAACRLTALPEDLSTLIPNLRVLNLNYNFLEDARPLEGLTRLRKLTIIGSRLKGTKPLIRLMQKTPEVEMLDFRMNPCTLGWYLPLLMKDMPGALHSSEQGDKKEETSSQVWQELDSKFRRDLPDESYVGRLAYRGLIMRACSRIRVLDGVEVTEKEKAKAHHLLVGILGKGRKMKEKADEGRE